MTGASELGSTINERRLSLHYSIGQLATVVGVTASDVRAWENGDRIPDDAALAKLAEALGVKKRELEKLVSATPPVKATKPADDDATAAIVAPGKRKPPAASTATEREPAAKPAKSEPGSKVAPPKSAKPSETVGTAKEDAERPTPAPQEPVGSPEGDGAGDVPLTDLPTERIPVITNAPPPPVREPSPATVQPAASAVATMAPPARRVDPATQAPTLVTPWRQTLEAIFDRDKPWLFWIRTALLLIGMLVLLRILAWAVPEFFTTLGEILDTIQSTTPDPELDDPIPIGP